jgi:hypothetical protein
VIGLAGGIWIIHAGLGLYSRDKHQTYQSTAASPDPDLDLPEIDGLKSHKDRSPTNLQQQALPFLEHNCVRCHGLVAPKGNITLVFADETAAKAAPAVWTKVIQALDSGQMPPPGRPRPEEIEARSFRAWVLQALSANGLSGVPLRRLNRAEYNNTVRDLLGTALTLADDFPADDSGEGFDNLAQVLSVSPTHIETYLRAADALVESARAQTELWQKLATPPVQDFIPYAMRGVPPERTEAVKGLQSGTDDGETRLRAQEIDRAYYALQAFADRAYRRPITHEEMYRLMHFVDQALTAGEGADAGLARVFKAILVAPHFLFRMELGHPAPAKERGLTDFELASRLSYFLWSTMPDEELFRLASKGELARPSILNAQVRRMLQDARSHALASNFAGQWLQIRALADTTRDPSRFPEFDDDLRRNMLEETERFFEHVVRTDQSALDLLLADYTFVNQRLARHYGLGGVAGDAFRQVSLASTERAGLLTHASILTVTAGATRTSPTKRGRWILDNVLGMPPMSPPPGVDTLANAAEGKLTSRQRFDLHRTRPECATCHVRMDPLGYGLEHFGSTGGWRERDDDGPIDATGVLPDGVAFHGAKELRGELAKHPAEFVRCLTQKLLIYALGRPLIPADRPALDAIVRHDASQEYRFSSLVIALVRSSPFRETRIQPAEKP